MGRQTWPKTRNVAATSDGLDGRQTPARHGAVLPIRGGDPVLATVAAPTPLVRRAPTALDRDSR